MNPLRQPRPSGRRCSDCSTPFPFLFHPDSSHQYFVEIGASPVLSQCPPIDQKLHPCVCFLRKLLVVKLVLGSGDIGWRKPNSLFTWLYRPWIYPDGHSSLTDSSSPCITILAPRILSLIPSQPKRFTTLIRGLLFIAWSLMKLGTLNELSDPTTNIHL